MSSIHCLDYIIDMAGYVLKKYRIKRSIIKSGGVIGTMVKLSVGGKFRFGTNIVLNDSGIDLSKWSHIDVSKGAILEIGDNSGLSQFSIVCKQFIKIGRFVNIGAGSLIMDTNFHSADWKVRRNHSIDKKSAKTAPVIIEDDVFIGARCIICKGVTIGARFIIAAGSVVVKNIPADCIAGGNPCKVIRYIR